uniref:uncharacterized protein n=1 Tax=Myxine glutinosa TaxID=7769 RepID=UPI00358E3B28
MKLLSLPFIPDDVRRIICHPSLITLSTNSISANHIKQNKNVLSIYYVHMIKFAVVFPIHVKEYVTTLKYSNTTIKFNLQKVKVGIYTNWDHLVDNFIKYCARNFRHHSLGKWKKNQLNLFQICYTRPSMEGVVILAHCVQQVAHQTDSAARWREKVVAGAPQDLALGQRERRDRCWLRSCGPALSLLAAWIDTPYGPQFWWPPTMDRSSFAAKHHPWMDLWVNVAPMPYRNWSLVRRATIHKHFSCNCNPSWNRYLSTMSRVEDPGYHLLSMRNQQMSDLQGKQPRLPVPRLEDTIRQYLKAERALLDDEAYRRTERICSSFEQGEGHLLQNELLAYDKGNQHTSYTTAFWLDRFLNCRASLLTSNYGINMEMASGSQLVCATNLVVSIARFHRTLKAGLLTPADSGGLAHRDGTGFVSGSRPKSYLMCMSQLNHLFGTSRIPHESRDELQTILGTRHFVVLHKGYIYTCNLFDDMDYILPASTIMVGEMAFINLHKTLHTIPLLVPMIMFKVGQMPTTQA